MQELRRERWRSNATAYVAKLMHRVPGMPWSAPVFDIYEVAAS